MRTCSAAVRSDVFQIPDDQQYDAQGEVIGHSGQPRRHKRERGTLLGLVGIDPIPWLTSTRWALLAVAIPRIWLQAGFATVLLLAGMQGISEEYYEAAKIDGAGFWHSWRSITVPLLTPSLFFLLVVTTLNAFQTFTEVNVLTKGGPVDSTQVVVHEIYRSFYFNGQYGLASAQALILFLIILGLTILQFTVVEKRVHYT